jgi:membrane protein implicated in regulation of membrane protease activity
MDQILQADIFFFISTIAVVIFSVLLLVAIYYLRETLQNFRDISRTLKRGVDNASEKVGDAFSDVEDSMVYKFIFGKKKKKSNKK